MDGVKRGIGGGNSLTVSRLEFASIQQKHNHWLSQGRAAPLKLYEKHIMPDPVLKVLGCYFCTTKVEEEKLTAQQSQGMVKLLQKLAMLPLSTIAKARVAQSIWALLPWTAIPSTQQTQGLRIWISTAARSPLRRGARSATAAMSIALKHHLLDPYAAGIYNLIRLLSPYLPDLLPLSWRQHDEYSTGPVAALAKLMRQLRLELSGHWVIAEASERTSLIQPPPHQRKRRMHSWGVVLRSAVISTGNKHRRE